MTDLPPVLSTSNLHPPRPRSTVRTQVRAAVTGEGVSLSPAVFLDRDGTLMEDVDYCKDPADVSVFDGTAEALQELKAAGFKLIIITNQSGIGRGYFSEEDFHAVQAELFRQLGEDVIDAAYYCPATPEEESTYRKPAPGLVFEAMREHRINPMKSFFVGDKTADITCGRRAGAKTILVETGYGADQIGCTPDHIAKDIVEAADLILNSLHG